MSRYTQRRRGSLLGDRRVVPAAVGVLAVTAMVAMLPQSSGAADGVADTALPAADGVRCVTVDGRRVPVSTDGRRPRFDRNPCAAATATATASSQAAPVTAEPAGDGAQNGGTQNGGTRDPGSSGEPLPANGTDPADTGAPTDIVNPTSGQQPQGQRPADGATPPSLGILGDSCARSRLQAHTGFQDGNRCVSTEFGEVGGADSNPSLIISSAPRFVRAAQPFDLRVTTRNLVRDRFLAAAQGGYYKESSFLTADGLVRGHFHTACRMLAGRTGAPDPAPAPAFFAATEDGKGGRAPDTVTVRVTGLPRGEAQCGVWAGDGSHRVPMMQRANQLPAFDVVRISVR